jgi:hypothetical protein
MLVSVASQTDLGLRSKHWKRRGRVICADPILAARLKTRPKTKLNPPRMRKNKDPEAAHRWLQRMAA